MRIEQITFTRFLAAMAIVVFHYGRSIFPFNDESVSTIFMQANVGVSYFFILSGFVMIIAYGQKTKISLFEYYKNRFARIYPVYLLALILFFYHIYQTKIDYYGLILNVFALQAWVPGKALSFNTPGWSLSVEFFFYALFPFLFNFIYKKKEHLLKIGIAIVLIWIGSQYLFTKLGTSSFYEGFPSKSHDIIHYFPLMHLSEFLMGNLAGLLFINKLSDKRKNYDLIVLMLVVMLFYALKFPHGYNFHNGLLGIIFVPLIIFISLNTGIITKIFKIKPLVFLGEISFGIYILQLPIWFFANMYFDKQAIADPTTRFYLYVISLIVISSISYLLIETPLRNQIKKIKLKKQKTVSVVNE